LSGEGGRTNQPRDAMTSYFFVNAGIQAHSVRKSPINNLN